MPGSACPVSGSGSMNTMKVVYIAAPLTADTPEGIAENRRVGALWAAWAALSGFSPVCSWIVLTGVLSEEHRELGLKCDCAQVERRDSVWLCGGRISGGMRVEALHAYGREIQIFDLTYLGRLPPAKSWKNADVQLIPAETTPELPERLWVPDHTA